MGVFPLLSNALTPSLAQDEIERQLGWIQTDMNRCGGYYLESPFTYAESLSKKNLISLSSNQGLFSLHGTSISQGKVTITRLGQQIVASKAYLYRDPVTGKLSAVDLSGNVILREPDTLIVAKSAHYDLKSSLRSLNDIIFRTAVYGNTGVKTVVTNQDLQKSRQVDHLSAWGQAAEFSQSQPKIYELQQTTYSTCPPGPGTCAWQIKASHIVLNKTTGRGVATHARLLVKGVPIFYTPYFNFPIDARRQTGFLPPRPGREGLLGYYLKLPFYWNMAPNYDMTITPSYLQQRGVRVEDLFRYLTATGRGNTNISIIPNDRKFSDFKNKELGNNQNSTNPFVQAELRRLLNAGDTRGSFSWQDNNRFNEHWTSAIDYNLVSDDYYLQDFSSVNLNAVTQNQLLQLGELDYKGEYWKSIIRIQGYQTLHPIDQQHIFQNSYTRLPQWVLEGSYPTEKTGLTFFINNDLSRFDIRHTPGDPTKMPVGNRFNVQPGISLPLNWPYLSLTPRIQSALTKYDVGNVQNGFPGNPGRALPIFDVSSTLYVDRNINLFGKGYHQTLEPQFYYTYIPFKNQNQLPVFDTTVNMLTYDQLFTYNRFSGLDRINDANQIALGITTRFIDDLSGTEKIKAALGQIFYFRNRKVTLDNAVDNPDTPENKQPRSPLSGTLIYSINPVWSLTANLIINPKTNNLDNQNVSINYSSDEKHLVNLGYNFVRNGDIIVPGRNSSENNLSQTDLSFTWPVTRDWAMVGRWTENLNQKRFQNLLFGLQYDSCCWAARMVLGEVFTGLQPNNKNIFQYNKMVYAEVALKGLGPFGTGNDPSQILNSNAAVYSDNFGRDF